MARRAGRLPVCRLLCFALLAALTGTGAARRSLLQQADTSVDDTEYYGNDPDDYGNDPLPNSDDVDYEGDLSDEIDKTPRDDSSDPPSRIADDSIIVMTISDSSGGGRAAGYSDSGGDSSGDGDPQDDRDGGSGPPGSTRGAGYCARQSECTFRSCPVSSVDAALCVQQA